MYIKNHSDFDAWELSAMYIIFLVHTCLTIYLCGVICFVQFIYYPFLYVIKDADFSSYEKWYVSRMISCMSLPLIFECITGWWLLFQKPSYVPLWLLWINGGLLAITSMTSLFVQVPLHNKLIVGFNKNYYHELIRSNWIRTSIWSLRSVILISIVYSLLNR